MPMRSETEAGFFDPLLHKCGGVGYGVVMTVSTTAPRTKPAHVRREELMDAAERKLLQSGLAGTSVESIIAAAGVSKGGFYHHFGSKEELLAALQERFATKFLDAARAAEARLPTTDWPGRLDAILETCARNFFASVALHDVLFHEFRPSDRRREMSENVVIDFFEQFLAGGHAAGAWYVERVRVTAIMLFSAMHAACDEAVLAPDDFSPDAAIATLKTFFARVLQID